MLWNKGFRDVVNVTPDGVVHINYTQFHEVEDLPAVAAGATTTPSAIAAASASIRE